MHLIYKFINMIKQMKKDKLAAIFWVLGIQYFITQIVVASAWATPFSLAHNTISDLGNTACGYYGGMQVCSPQHSWMNVSFILLGMTQAGGAILLYKATNHPFKVKLGLISMILAGVGTTLVGLFPENTIAVMHILGATLPFLVGNIGLVLLGLNLKMPKKLRIYTTASGLIALVGLILYMTRIYVGIGIGGMERLVAYPQTIWLVVFGIYLLSKKSTLNEH